jgi:hypothetical protein
MGRPSSTNRSSSALGAQLATAIEQLLYEDRAVHGVSEVAVSSGVIRLRLVPWAGPPVHTAAVFNGARLTSAETYPNEPGDLDLLWEVIGFDCYDLGSGRRRFVLHCYAIEWCFESTWPLVTRAGWMSWHRRDPSQGTGRPSSWHLQFQRPGQGPWASATARQQRYGMYSRRYPSTFFLERKMLASGGRSLIIVCGMGTDSPNTKHISVG